MKSTSCWLASCTLVSTVAGITPIAHAYQAPASLPNLPSSSTLLRNNPELATPIGPRRDDDAKHDPARAPLDAPHGRPSDAFEVTRIVVENVPDVARAAVAAVVDPHAGERLTLAQLRAIAVRVTAVLSAHGESLSYASIPPQEIRDGVVRLRVVKGHLESVMLGKNDSLVSDEVVRRYVRRAARRMDDLSNMENALLRLADLPGVGEVSPVLSAGKAPGTSAMTIDAGASSRAELLALADNTGSTVSGRNRIGLQLSVDSPLRVGDRLQAIAFVSPDFLQFNSDSNGGITTVGRLSYDVPVNAMNTRMGAAVSRVDYTLGGKYRDVGVGYANVFGFYATQPLIRTRFNNLELGVGLDYKEMRDSLVGNVNKRTARVMNVRLSGDHALALLGMTTAVEYQFGLNYGQLHNSDEFYGAMTRGSFLKATQNIAITQGIRRGVYVQLSVTAQQTSRNLDGAEKMVLGGPNAVRGYGNDIVSADMGVVASATLNMAVPKVKGLTLKAFYDVAQARVQKFGRWPARAELSGYGVGASYALNKRAFVSISAARPNGHTELGQRPSGQVWVSMAVRI